MNGHIAVVTGCASGIGLEICILLAGKGWKVFGLDVNEEGLKQLRETAHASDLRIVTLTADITDVASCDQAFGIISCDDDVRARGVDVLVNNAGITFPCPLLDTPWDRVQLMYGVNVLGPIYLSRIFLPQLLRAPSGGHIINMSSMAGQSAWPWQGAYSCTKYSLEGFSDCLRREALASGLSLRVTSVCPGGVRTALSAGLLQTRLRWCETNPSSVFQPAARRSFDRMKIAERLHDYFMQHPRDVAECVCVAASSTGKRGPVRMEPATFPMQILRWLLLTLPLSLADALTTQL